MGDRNQGITSIPPFFPPHDVYGPKLSRWKGYKTQFPHSNLKFSDEDPWDKVAGYEFRCQWSEKDKKFRYQRRLNDKCRREELVYQNMLESRRRKLRELLAGEKKYLEEARRKMEIGKTQRLGILKEELKAVKERQENDHRHLVEACLMRKKIALDDKQRLQKNRAYAQDLKAQMAMNDAISVEKAWEEAIMSERKSLEPWMTGHADEHDNLASQSYRALSEGLRTEKMQYLQAKERAKEIRQKAYEDLKAHNERIKREDQEERDRMAARKASLKKEFEDQIQTRRAILQGRSEDEETVKQAYVIAAQSPPDESLQKKVQKKKEIMGFLDYVRDFQTEQKKRNVEVGRLFEEEARKVMTKQQEVRDVKARAQTIRQAETKATLLDQMRAKQVQLAKQDNQAYDPDKCFLNKLFDADALRQRTPKALQNRCNHGKETEEIRDL